MNSTADDEKELITSWDTPAYGDDRPEIGRVHHPVLYVIAAALIAAIIAIGIMVSSTGTPGGDQPDSDLTPQPAAPTVTVLSTVVITQTVGS